MYHFKLIFKLKLLYILYNLICPDVSVVMKPQRDVLETTSSIMGVSRNTVARWLSHWKERDSLAPDKGGGRKKIIFPQWVDVSIRFIITSKSENYLINLFIM